MRSASVLWLFSTWLADLRLVGRFAVLLSVELPAVLKFDWYLWELRSLLILGPVTLFSFGVVRAWRVLWSYQAGVFRSPLTFHPVFRSWVFKVMSRSVRSIYNGTRLPNFILPFLLSIIFILFLYSFLLIFFLCPQHFRFSNKFYFSSFCKIFQSDRDFTYSTALLLVAARIMQGLLT